LQLDDLPPEISNQLRSAGGAHFTLVAPNTTAALVTVDTMAELPPGYVVVMVFNAVSKSALPPAHQQGQVYIVEK